MAVINNNKKTFYTGPNNFRVNTTGLGNRQVQRIERMVGNQKFNKAKKFARRKRQELKIPTTGGNLAPPTTPPMTELPPGTTETLFPNTRMFEPKNYEGSPLYQFQLKEGQKQLARSLAAKGLTNSGHAIEEELAIPMRAAAQDTDRMTRIASENADRLYNFQNNEALRKERMGNAQWDRAYGLAELMSRESPWNEAFSAVDSTGKYKQAKGQAHANFLSNYYKTVLGPMAGGGGRQPLPLPSGPDYSNIDLQQINADRTSNDNWIDLLTTGIANLF